MKDITDTIQDTFDIMFASLNLVFEFIIKQTNNLFGTLTAVIFIIILALFFGMVLNNRKVRIPKIVAIVFVVVSLLIAIYILFIEQSHY